jgi:hypothetical protein
MKKLSLALTIISILMFTVNLCAGDGLDKSNYHKSKPAQGSKSSDNPWDDKYSSKDNNSEPLGSSGSGKDGFDYQNPGVSDKPGTDGDPWNVPPTLSEPGDDYSTPQKDKQSENIFYYILKSLKRFLEK